MKNKKGKNNQEEISKESYERCREIALKITREKSAEFKRKYTERLEKEKEKVPRRNA